jgi:cytochrome c oxidase subunit 2
MSSSAKGTQFDTNVILTIAVPIVLAVWVYFGYALVVWRVRPGDDDVDGPPLRSHFGVQFSWIAATTAIVIGLFGFGTYELVSPAGAGGGEGPQPAWAASGHVSAVWTPGANNILVVQVIGQQWKWSYRYPQFGGFETDQLMLPDNTTVAFHVTSLDVIHGFWAYQLGVKADANPGLDNVAFTTTEQLGSFMVRCDELCGLWHGAMYNSGSVVSTAGFDQWATSTETSRASQTALLPGFAWTYVPDANGSDGGFYPDNEDPYGPGDTYVTQPTTTTSAATSGGSS